jgi:hypothetical protein
VRPAIFLGPSYAIHYAVAQRKRIVKKFWTFIDTTFITLQALFAVVAVVVTEVLNQRNLQQTFIIALLVMIVIDFYLLFTNRLKQLANTAQDIASGLATRGVGVEFVERHTFDWRAAVASARHDIFISGTTLTGFVPGKDVFAALDTHVQVRFLVLDVANRDILEGFRRMRYADSSRHSLQRYLNQASLFKDLYNALHKRSNIQFAVADRITPMAFIAIDTKRLSESSFIRVQHYLHENESDSATVSYIVRPGSTVYSLYAEQIRILWDASQKTGTYLETP